MNKIDISILMPAIRRENWNRVYQSILGSTKRSFELIIVSPFPLTDELQGLVNVKYVKDFGSPVRCSNIGALLAEGKYFYPTHADDGYFIKDSIDNNIKVLEDMGNDKKNIVACKYSESDGLTHPERYQDDDYYKLVNAYPVSRDIIPKDWLIFNSVFWHREYFDEFGGWDSSYGACPMSHADLAIRAQRDGAIVKLSNYPLTQNDHGQNDHGPIEVAQLQYDAPRFRYRYSQPLDTYPIKIKHDNWKEADRVWKFRFTEVPSLSS